MPKISLSELDNLIAEKERQQKTKAFIQQEDESLRGHPVIDFGLGVAQGLGDLGTGAAKLVQKVPEPDINKPPTGRIGRLERAILPESAFKKDPMLDKLLGRPSIPEVRLSQYARSPAIEKAGEIGSYFLAPGEVGLERGITKGLGKVGMPYLGRFLGSTAEGALTGAGYSAIGGGSPITGALLGGGVGGALAGPASYVGSKLSKMANSAKDLIKRRTPEKARELLSHLKDLGMNIDFGTLTNNPRLINLYQEKLGSLMPSIKDDLERNINKADEYASNFMKKLRGNVDPAEIDEKLRNSIKNNYYKHEATKESLYDEAGRLGDKKGFNLIDRPKLKELASKVLSDINEAKARNSEPPFKGYMVDVLKRAAADTPADAKRTFSHAMYDATNYDKLANDAMAKGDLNASGMFGSLKNAMEQDIENYVEHLGDKDLTSKWYEAKKHFRENVAPYRSKDIQNILKKEGKEDFLNTLKKGENFKVLEDLTPNEKNLLLYQGIRKADDELGSIGGTTPQKIIKKMESITPAQRKRLITKSVKKNIPVLQALADVTEHSRITAKAVHATGRSLKKEAVAKLPWLVGMFAASAMPEEERKEIMGTLLGGLVGAKGLRMAMESPRLQRAFIEQNIGRTPVNPLLRSVATQIPIRQNPMNIMNSEDR